MSKLKSRGRPRIFDRQAALDAAMERFWRYGYEGTSISDLTEAMGCTAPTLYGLFGSKEQLYREILEHYLHLREQRRALLLEGVSSVYAALEISLRAAALAFSDGSGPTGCLVSTASLNCARENFAIVNFTAGLRASGLESLSAEFQQAQQSGELPAAIDPIALARFYIAVLQGMSVQAIDGAAPDELNQLVDIALLAWPGKRPVHSVV